VSGAIERGQDQGSEEGIRTKHTKKIKPKRKRGENREGREGMLCDAGCPGTFAMRKQNRLNGDSEGAAEESGEKKSWEDLKIERMLSDIHRWRNECWRLEHPSQVSQEKPEGRG